MEIPHWNRLAFSARQIQSNALLWAAQKCEEILHSEKFKRSTEAQVGQGDLTTSYWIKQAASEIRKECKE